MIFRSIKWVLIPIISSTYSIVCMIGLIGFLNWEVTAISSNFISLMLILSISMNIHIINNYRLHFDQKNSAKTLNTTLKKMFWPCFYTALTTIVAFGSLIFSDIKPVIDFGKIMILGLVVILITSFTILPLLISIFPKIDMKKNFQFSILPLFFKISVNHKMKIYTFYDFRVPGQDLEENGQKVVRKLLQYPFFLKNRQLQNVETFISVNRFQKCLDFNSKIW